MNPHPHKLALFWKLLDPCIRTRSVPTGQLSSLLFLKALFPGISFNLAAGRLKCHTWKNTRKGILWISEHLPRIIHFTCYRDIATKQTGNKSSISFHSKVDHVGRFGIALLSNQALWSSLLLFTFSIEATWLYLYWPYEDQPSQWELL